MFLNPFILAGLGGAAIPLVLHLLARARYRNVDWGAMMFLQGINPRQSQSARVKQWVLLGVRMLLVAMIAVALARPIARGSWGGMPPDTRIRAVIILDRSYSMAFEEAGKSRFDKAREAALAVLSGLRRGDEVALVLMGDQIEAKAPTSDLQVAARDLADAQVSTGSADIAAALDKARNILQRDPRFRRELYLITDRQAVSWRNISRATTETLWLNDASAPVRFYVIPVGGEETENIAVESMELTEPVAVRRHPAEVEVRLRNYASRPRTGIELTLADSASPRRHPTTVPVNIPPRASAAVRIPITFDQPGSHLLTAAVKAPELETDNRFDSALEVLDAIPVLIVSGDETGPELRRESAFLRLALSPHQSLRGGRGDPAAVTVKTFEEFSTVDLSKFRVIILANVPEIGPDQARALEQRIYEGGGLIICPGSLCRIDEYNTTLYRDGQGLLPARLMPPVAADGSEATIIAKLDPNHPIFRFRAGADWMPDAVIGRYFPVAARGDAKVLGAYESGSPFLVETRRGRGRVLLVTTPLDADWSTLPLDGSAAASAGSGAAANPAIPQHPFYLPFIQSMVQYACAPTVAVRNLAPGESIVANFDMPIASAELFRNDQSLGQVPVTGGGTQVRYGKTEIPGIYRLLVKPRSGPMLNSHYVVQGSRSESDLTPLTNQQWDGYQRLLGFVKLDSVRQPIAPFIASDRGGQELWLILLVAAVFVAVGELWLARIWSKEVA